MLKQEPTKAFECLTVIGGGLSPLLFSNLIHSFIECFNDMETIQNQRSVGAVIFDGSYISLAHVAASPLDLLFLVVTKVFGKEFINGSSSLALADPHNTSPIKIIDDGSVLMPFAVRDFINPYGFKTPNFVSRTKAGYAAVQEIGQG
jgi:hypothetical protein